MVFFLVKNYHGLSAIPSFPSLRFAFPANLARLHAEIKPEVDLILSSSWSVTKVVIPIYTCLEHKFRNTETCSLLKLMYS